MPTETPNEIETAMVRVEALLALTTDADGSLEDALSSVQQACYKAGEADNIDKGKNAGNLVTMLSFFKSNVLKTPEQREQERIIQDQAEQDAADREAFEAWKAQQSEPSDEETETT